MSDATNAITSTPRRGVQSIPDGATQSRIAGATSNAPAASPSHQVHQMGPKSDHRANPVRQSELTPKVALREVQARARPVKANTVPARSKAWAPAANPVTSAA